jgi:hypothetical protein
MNFGEISKKKERETMLRVLWVDENDENGMIKVKALGFFNHFVVRFGFYKLA